METFPYKTHANLDEAGVHPDKLEQAILEFSGQLANGAFPGGQLAIRKNGKLAVNFACGIARNYRKQEGAPPVEVRPDTPFPALSAGKPIAAIAIAMLEDRGKLEVETPIVDFIPEFSKHGKGKITILDVLTHQAGIILPELTTRPQLWGDRQAVLEVLVNAKPVIERGKIMYAAYEYGWLLSEIFLHVEGRTLADFIADEISGPLGLPALRYGLAGRNLDDLAFTYWLGKDKMMVSNINVAEGFEATNNSLEQINSMNPAVSLVTDATSLSAFYEFLLNGGVSHSGKQLISAKTLQKYISLNKSGLDRSSRMLMRLGRGFMLGSRLVSTYGWGNTEKCFGHAGGFSSLAYGDPDTNTAVAILTNGNRDFFDLAKRFIPLAHKIRQACK